MKQSWPKGVVLKRIEVTVAVSLTFLLVFVHVVFFLHAGPLWRDEISSLSLATRPTFAEFWKYLAFDPFPASYFLLVRSWHAVGLGGNDLELRGLGLLIGILLIGAVWLSCYVIDKVPPLWPLVLFAFSPLTVVDGDSLRPYGFGLIWIVLTFAFVWRICCGEVGKRSVSLAVILAVLSVQSLFTNALILFGIAMGAIIVLLRQRSWRRSAIVLGIGLIAALTLLVYLPIVRTTSDWSKIIANENNLTTVTAVGNDAIASAGPIGYWAWMVLSAGLLVTFVISIWPHSKTSTEGASLDSFQTPNREQTIFAGATLLICAAAIVEFLIAARYLVYPRYFLPVTAIGALCLHLACRAMAYRAAARIASLILALAVGITSFPSLYARAKMRMTNCDEIAMALQQRADADDLIIVTSPLYGISFQRYYHGEAKWVTLPQLDDLALHRWDLVKEAMGKPDPVPNLLLTAEKVLESGHRVFLVGKLGPAPPSQPQSPLPAPQSLLGWHMEAYTSQWKSELTYWIEHHAIHGTNLPIEQKVFVHPSEQLGLFEVSGWREPTP